MFFFSYIWISGVGVHDDVTDEVTAQLAAAGPIGKREKSCSQL